MALLIDTHAHLSDTRFDTDRAAAIERASAAGVKHIIEISCEPKDWQNSRTLAEEHAGVWLSFGIHPHEAGLADDEAFAALEKLLAHPLCVAAGEMGLDYHHNHSPRDAQENVFKRQIALARAAGLPLVIHCREAFADTRKIISEIEDAPRGVLHCFSGSSEDAHFFIDRGFLLGIDGPITYPGAGPLREALKGLPLDCFLLETDCPYLAPQSRRGTRNEPAFVAETALALAELTGRTAEEVFDATTANAARLFARMRI